MPITTREDKQAEPAPLEPEPEPKREQEPEPEREQEPEPHPEREPESEPKREQEPESEPEPFVHDKYYDYVTTGRKPKESKKENESSGSDLYKAYAHDTESHGRAIHVQKAEEEEADEEVAKPDIHQAKLDRFPQWFTVHEPRSGKIQIRQKKEMDSAMAGILKHGEHCWVTQITEIRLPNKNAKLRAHIKKPSDGWTSFPLLRCVDRRQPCGLCGDCREDGVTPVRKWFKVEEKKTKKVILRQRSAFDSETAGEVKDGTRVRVDWCKEVTVEAGGGMGKVKKMRAHICDPAVGWLSMQLLKCEDGDCGMCTDCKL